jgi:hypothetical protein
VARNRYRWFGKKDACMMPTPENRARFLVDWWAVFFYKKSPLLAMPTKD